MADGPNIFAKQYILPAGPTPLPPKVSQVMAEPMLYHRAPAFVEVYARVLERLKRVFGTRNEVLMFAASGSGAMESAVANLVRPGEPALVASCGKFGERWAELCDAYGARTIHFQPGWGNKVEPQELDRELEQNPDVALVLTEKEGLEKVYERHPLLGRATRQAARALDLELFGPEDENANVVTAIRLPESIDGTQVPKLMRDRFGVTIAGGQGKLKGKIARIAHCGYFGAFDIVIAV